MAVRDNAGEVELLPGTEIMSDRIGPGVQESETLDARVLVPRPSNSPHDPLVRLNFHTVSSITTGSFSLHGDQLRRYLLTRRAELEPLLEDCHLPEPGTIRHHQRHPCLVNRSPDPYFHGRMVEFVDRGCIAGEKHSASVL